MVKQECFGILKRTNGMGDRFLQILSAANKQYAGARTPDRQQAAGTAAAFAAAALLPKFR